MEKTDGKMESDSYKPASSVPERVRSTRGGPWKVAVRAETCDRAALEENLRKRLRGTVRFDDLSRAAYSTDASIYQVEPLGVATPLDEEDVKVLLEVCRKEGASVTPRCAGTSLAGQACGHGVAVDMARRFDRIIEIDRSKRLVRLQPGVVLDHLNNALERKDLFFGPDVATSSRATLGGLVGNNSSGARSILYGMTIHHLERVRCVLSDGTVVDWGPVSGSELRSKHAETNREGQLLDGLCDILVRNREEIRSRFPKTLRRVGGYPLDDLLRQYEETERDENATFNPALLFCGSEGTLGILTEITLRLVPLQRQKNLILLEFDGVQEALRAVPFLVTLDPSAVELLDHNVLDRARESPGLREDIRVLQGSPRAILIVEFLGSDLEELNDRVAKHHEAIRKEFGPTSSSLLQDPADQAKVWNIRKAGLGMMQRMRGHAKPCAFIEDAAVPIDRVGQYVKELFDSLASEGLKAGAYAHASVGLLHIRPIIDLYSKEGIVHLRRIAEKSVELSLKLSGAFSGEHGDGLARSEFLPVTHGKALCNVFKEIKRLFDPDGIMNPGKIVDPYPMDRNLRYGEGYSPTPVKTFFDYRDWGTFSEAIDMCSGVGQCRNTKVATMCPSYMATKNELHTTRARANALRSALNGRIGDENIAGPGNDYSWATDAVMEALDLCLSCKACKTECPTGVDMAMWKAEALYARYHTHGVPLSARLIAHYPRHAKLASALAPLSNTIAQSKPARVLMEFLFGLDKRVPPPLFHRQTFRKWFADFRTNEEYLRSGKANGAQTVVLFVDTYMNHNQPFVGIAATRVLMAAGFHVVVLDNVDEGRTYLSKGFLDRARRLARKNVAILEQAVDHGWPIVGCEPGSILAFRDEVPDLVQTEAARRVSERCQTLAEFLDKELADGHAELRLMEIAPPQRILFHGHCHSKSLADPQAAVRLLQRIPGTEASMIDAGCCGMAGAFGHEKAHYETARLVGEERLFPAVRAAGGDARIVTEGFSCHHHVEHHLPGTRTAHYAEILREALAD
jgi:FAD/FMN-containing dehydrogenase/Fe-S oxidoreductase